MYGYVVTISDIESIDFVKLFMFECIYVKLVSTKKKYS